MKIPEYAYKIVETIENQAAMAERMRLSRPNSCKRKAVCCSIIPLSIHQSAYVVNCNGPTIGECCNVTGGCGCMHAEIRALLSFVRIPDFLIDPPPLILCTYSPCTNCANAIISLQTEAKIPMFSGVIYKYLTGHDSRGASLLSGVLPTLATTELLLASHNEKDPLHATIAKWKSDGGDTE